jgi:hypothetical protein
MHNTRQGVARPAPLQNNPDENYEQDAQRRHAVHDGFWSQEPLTDWQEFILCRELNCGRRPRFTRGPRALSLEEVLS